MTDGWPARVRATYDSIAADYAKTFADELAHKPLDRALLRAFAEVVPYGPVLDAGCGPGQATRALADLGLAPVGLDLAPGMLREARWLFPGLPFVAGSMLALPVGDASLAGAVALYSVIHLPPEARPVAFAELARAIRPGGWLLVSFHVSSPDFPAGAANHLQEWFGRPADVIAYFLPPDEIAGGLERAGFEVAARLLRAPNPALEYPSERCYLMARRIGDQ